MLRLEPFELAMPATLGEALALLASRERSMLIAGGTDLVPKLKRMQFSPELVVSLERVAVLRESWLDNGTLVIGGHVPLREIESSALLDDLPALRGAIQSVATPILRNRATLAGNLLQDTRCHYVDRSKGWREGVNDCLKLGTDGCRVAPGADRCYAALCSDVAPMLAVLDAEVVLVASDAAAGRRLPVEQLYRDDGIHNLRLEGEVLTEVRIPRRAEHAVYKKLRMRGSFDFPELGVALRAVDHGSELELKVAVSAVAPHLHVLHSRIEPGASEEWIRAFCATVKPMDTGFFPPDYRKQVLKNFLKQALHELVPHR